MAVWRLLGTLKRAVSLGWLGPKLDGSRCKREWEKREIDNSFKGFSCRGEQNGWRGKGAKE